MMRIQNPDDNRFIYRLRIKFMKCEAANCTGGNWAGRPSGRVCTTREQSGDLAGRGQRGRGDGHEQEFGRWADLLESLSRRLGPRSAPPPPRDLYRNGVGGGGERHRTPEGWGCRTTSATNNLCDLESLLAGGWGGIPGFIPGTNSRVHSAGPHKAQTSKARPPHLLSSPALSTPAVQPGVATSARAMAFPTFFRSRGSVVETTKSYFSKHLKTLTTKMG